MYVVIHILYVSPAGPFPHAFDRGRGGNGGGKERRVAGCRNVVTGLGYD